MKTFFLSFLGAIAALVLFFVLTPLAILGAMTPSTAPIHSAILELDLRDALPDQPATDGMSALLSGDSFVEILLRLNAAATDTRVKGVFVRAAEAELPSSRAEELRAAFQRLRAKGKFVIAHSQGFMGSGPAAYRAVAGADELWIQPGADFEIPGIAFETLFLGEALRKLKVTPEIEQLYEYKNAVDVYKQDGYTPAHAEAMTALAESVWSQSAADIEADRGAVLKARGDAILAMSRTGGGGDPDLANIAPAEQVRLAQGLTARLTPPASTQAPAVAPQALPSLRTLLENSPYSAEEAVLLGLADKLGWPEEAAEEARSRAGGDLVLISDYAPPAVKGRGVVAIVGGEGDIVTGYGGGDLTTIGDAVFASDRVAADMIDLIEDDSVSAVVFRVDSGGGSAIASDQVWRAVKRLQDSGKPVVVSMGSMAASGGYYVAAGAQSIVSNGSTITGSIGVFGGKFAAADGLRMIGVTPDQVFVGGEQSSAWSLERLSNSQRARLIDSLEGIYARFTGIVAEGRKLPVDKVHELAKGRVWSGADALRLGLVDSKGDLIAAVDKAKELAGLAAGDKVEIRLKIMRASPLELLQGALVSARVSAADPDLVRALGAISGDPRARTALRQLRRAAQESGAQVWTPSVAER